MERVPRSTTMRRSRSLSTIYSPKKNETDHSLYTNNPSISETVTLKKEDHFNGNGPQWFITGGTEGEVQQGPVRARVLKDLSAEEKERYKADIRATNILLQGSELTKDDRESQLYDEFEHFCQIKGETIQGYYVRFTKLINDMRNIKMTMSRMQLNSKFVNNMCLRGMSDASVPQYPAQSSKSPQSSTEPYPSDNFQLDSGVLNRKTLIEVYHTLALLYTIIMMDSIMISKQEQNMYNTTTLLTLNADNTVIINYSEDQYVEDNEEHVVQLKRPDFNSFFKIKNLEHQIKEKDNVIRHLKDLVASVNDRSREPYNAVDVTALIEQNDCDRVELEKVKQHYKELYDSIKINRAHTNISHLKESVETVREIVEEARVVKPLDSSLNYACRYTKLSQEFYPTVRTVLNKEKQIWKPKSKLSDNNLETQKANWSDNFSKTRGFGKANEKTICYIGYQWRPTGKKLTLGKLDCGSQWRPTGKKFALGEICQFTKLSVKCSTLSANQQVPGHRLLKTYNGERSKPQEICGKVSSESVRFGNDHLRAIIGGYGDYLWGTLASQTVRFIRTDNGTEFVNQVMSEYYEGVGIFHQKSVPRTPQQNGVVERRNRTLVEAARTMMIFSKAPMFLWAEAVATACYTQNRSLIHTRHNKTPYELVHDKKPDLTFFRVFGALCYPANDSENLGKFQAKADIGIFVGYAPSRKGYRIYNKRTRRLMETIHVTFDEMHQSMAPVRISSGPEPIMMTPGQLKTGLAPTDKELEMLFQPMFDEHLEQSRVNEPVPSATEINAQVVPPGTSLSTTIAQDAPSTSASSSTSGIHLPVQHQEIAEEPIQEDTPIIHDVLFFLLPHNLVSEEPQFRHNSSSWDCDTFKKESLGPVNLKDLKTWDNPTTRITPEKKALVGLSKAPRAWDDITLKVPEGKQFLSRNTGMDLSDPVDTPMVDRLKRMRSLDNQLNQIRFLEEWYGWLR
ncbi:retrovirus-related pol polyprotein from transposon TNT 1-94 [Tanacetum coccineum]